MRLLDLPVLVLQQIRAVAMQHPRPATAERRRVLARIQPMPRRFHADQPHRGIVQERVKQPNGIAPAADGRNRHIRQPPFGLLHLRLRLNADNTLKIAHHRRIRVRSSGSPDNIKSVVHIRHPVAHGVVHRILQRRGARTHRNHLRPQQLHAEHIRLLPLHVDRAHVNRARQAKQRAHRRGRHAMLPSARLRDNPRLAHPPRQQNLAQAVVDLMRPGMVQLVALKINLCAPKLLGQPLGKPQRARPSHIMLQVIIQLGLERRVGLRRLIRRLQLQNQRHQRLGDKPPAKFAKPATPIRAITQRIGDNLVHAPL